MGKNFVLLLFLIFSLLLPVNGYAGSNSDNYIENIRYGNTSSGVRIVFDLGEKVDYRAFALADNYRIVIDIPKVQWRHQKSGSLSGNNLIKSYRSGNLDSGITRVVFDLKESALIDRIFHLDKSEGFNNRLVVDIKSVTKARFEANRKQVFGAKDLTPPPQVKVQKETPVRMSPIINTTTVTTQKEPLGNLLVPPVANVPARKPVYSVPQKRTVVIDAGHGGADPGATLNGYYEKNITLAIAKALQEGMLKVGKYNVVMTRDKDVYITLRDRKDIARKVNADLFISIHADSIGRTDVRGASIYTLSETASDAETARLAESENNSGFVAGVDLSHESVEVANILLDLSMRSKMNESNMFAKMLEDSLRKNNIRMLGNARRSAGFAVLKAPDVPSILVEAGFLSNLHEAKLLSTTAFQRKFASSLLQSIDDYFRKIDELQKF